MFDRVHYSKFTCMILLMFISMVAFYLPILLHFNNFYLIQSNPFLCQSYYIKKYFVFYRKFYSTVVVVFIFFIFASNLNLVMVCMNNPNWIKYQLLIGGERGIRTLACLHICQFSKLVPSASWVFLHTDIIG